MRVALACPYAWDAFGGVQTHIRELAVALRTRGHDVLVLAPARRPKAVHSVQPVGRAIGVRFGGSVAPICASPASARRIERALREFGPDVVHAHEPFAPSTALFAARASPVPVVATFHSFDPQAHLRRSVRPLLRRLARSIDAGIAVSSAAKAAVAEEVGAPLSVLPNGVDPARFGGGMPLRQRPPHVLWVHRLDPRKGFPIALDAFLGLADAHREVRLVVVGDGPDRSFLRRLAPETRARIDFAAAVPDPALPDHHARARLFVAAATGRESFGISLVEAMAAGLPVVATNIPGYREIVRDGVEGLLVPPGDAGALRAAIARLLSDADLAATLGARGRARADGFSWERLLPRIEEIYERTSRRARRDRR